MSFYNNDDEAYGNGFETGFSKGHRQGNEEAVAEARALLDMFHNSFPTVKSYQANLTNTQREFADTIIRVINIATFTERQRCLDIVEDCVAPTDENSEMLNDIEQRIKGN